MAIALTEKESEIRSYLVNGVQLQEEHLEELIAPFWTSEPYKLVQNKNMCMSMTLCPKKYILYICIREAASTLHVHMYGWN